MLIDACWLCLTLLLGGPGFACCWQNFWCYFRGAELHFYWVARAEKISGAVSEHQSTSMWCFRAAKHHFYWVGPWWSGLVLVTDVGSILSSPLATDHSSQRHKGVVWRQYFNHPLRKYLLTLWYFGNHMRKYFLTLCGNILGWWKGQQLFTYFIFNAELATHSKCGGIVADWRGNHDNTIAKSEKQLKKVEGKLKCRLWWVFESLDLN